MNPFTSALNKIQGRSVVNNAANPGSAYSMQQRNLQAGPTKQSAQSKMLQQGIKKTFASVKGKTFGTPIK